MKYIQTGKQEIELNPTQIMIKKNKLQGHIELWHN